MNRPCPSCLRPADPSDRWCGACGTALPPLEATPPEAEALEPNEVLESREVLEPGPSAGPEQIAGSEHPADDTGGGSRLRRRRVLALGGSLLGGAVLGWFVRGLAIDDWVDVGAVDRLLAAVEQDGAHLADEVGGPDRHAVVRWDPSRQRTDGLRADIVYASEPVVGTSTGLMVLVLRSTHGGCPVRLCATSRWFEDLCFGSRFNAWGEWVGGPAPRGLDRRPSRIVDGRLQVSRTGFTIGVARESRMLDQEASGPNCVDM